MSRLLYFAAWLACFQHAYGQVNQLADGQVQQSASSVATSTVAHLEATVGQVVAPSAKESMAMNQTAGSNAAAATTAAQMMSNTISSSSIPSTASSAAPTSTSTDSLASIEHVILFMQENRAFDHYFGTMAGVRGYQDPTMLALGNKSALYQPLSIPTNGTYLLPWHLTADSKYMQSAQCMLSGSNDWTKNHQAGQNGANDGWVVYNTPYSWGHFIREDIPTHFSIAEAFTVGDHYSQSVIGPTNPNRAAWASGTINVPGGNTSPNQGGVYIENWASPGCEYAGVNCWPLKWNTTVDYLQDAGVSWYVYQDLDNFGDNPFINFENFQQAEANTPLAKNAMSYDGVQKFLDDCANGTLPQVSYIVGPMELSEHPPWMPKDGAWLWDQVVSAVTKSPLYNSTALFITYDESGGWGDHVPFPTSPNGTAGEWLTDPNNVTDYVPSGPGPRVPFVIVSPWTAGGHVFTEHADHSSQIMFVEQWLATKGINITTPNIPPWRRQYMSNLVNAFDFTKPNYTAPTIVTAGTPDTNEAGDYMGTINCLNQYNGEQPPPPYGKQVANVSLQVEAGYKAMRGQPTEGRCVVFVQQNNGLALTLAANGTKLVSKPVQDNYMDVSQGFCLAEFQDVFINSFSLQSAANTSLYVGAPSQPSVASSSQFSTNSSSEMSLFSGASTIPMLSSYQEASFTINYQGNGSGFTLQVEGYYYTKAVQDLPYIGIAANGAVTWSDKPIAFDAYSVTYPTAPHFS